MSFLSLVWVATAAEPEDRQFRGCDLRDRVVVDAYNDAVEASADPTVARRRLAKVLGRQPACYAAIVLDAELTLRQADPAALVMLAEALTTYPDDPILLAMVSRGAFLAQDFETAAAFGVRAREADPTSPAAVATEQSALVRLGRYDEALAVLADRVQLAPAHRACFRGLVYVDQRRADEAAAELELCRAGGFPDLVETLQTNLDVVRGVGSAGSDTNKVAFELMTAGNYEEALPKLQDAWREEPWNAAARLNLAVTLLRLGRRAEARPHLDALLSAEPWVTIYTNGQVTGVVTKGGELELEKAVERGAYLLVETLADLGDLDGAVVALRKGEARFGRSAVMVAASVRLESIRSPAAAWPLARAALASFPADSYVLRSVGQLAFAHPDGIDAAVMAAATASSDPIFRQNVLASLANGQRAQDCAALAVRWASAPVPEELGEVRSIGYGCAVSAGDLIGAGVLYSVDMAAAVRGAHAVAAWEGGDHPRALALAAEAVGSPDGRAAATWVLALGAVEDRRYREAVSLVGAEGVRAGTRLDVGIALYNAGEYALAREVVAGLDCQATGAFASRCREAVKAIQAAH